MQTVVATSQVVCRPVVALSRPALPTRKAARKPVAAASRRTVVQCSAETPKQGKIAAAIAAASAALTSSPAFAVVDERLYGEGTGKILGVNDSILAVAIVGVFGLIWALFYTSDLPNFKDEESGLDL